ncbi:MAG: HAMP domain-containing histidine kinase [bacterium]|nr:HAMP domain-containing histidine kinase [bacterium]
MVGRAVTGTLVLASYLIAPAASRHLLALPLGLFPFLVNAVLWMFLRHTCGRPVLKRIALAATLADLAVIAGLVLGNLIPVLALPLILVLPIDELSIRYRVRGAAIGMGLAATGIIYALMREGAAWDAQRFLTLFWLLGLAFMLGGVRGAIASFANWRARILAEKSEHAAAMARQLATLLELSSEILQQRDVDDVLSSVAVGVSRIFGFKYVTICFQTAPGGDFERRVLWGFPSQIVAERSGERIDRRAFVEALSHSQEIVDHCYYSPAEQYVTFKNEIYVDEQPPHAERAKPGAWHGRDSMAFVMTDAHGDLIGYMSVDGPADGMVPSRETMISMQVFVNMAGLAIINADRSVRASENARLEAEARRLQMEFLSEISHEIRAPLATIQGASSLLRTHSHELEPKRRNEFLGAVHDAARGLAHMVEDLLLLSKLETGHFRLDPEPVDLLAVTRDAVRATLGERPGALVSLAVPPEPLPPVWADPQRLQQILMNLLSNALKYAPMHTAVYLQITHVDGGALVSVSDDGPGIPEEERAKLFTRFGSLSNAKADSTGLGLYISKSLALAMEGDLDCDSEPGAGTTFSLRLRFAGWKAEPDVGGPQGGAIDDALGEVT